jgi:hypothetical protein
MIRVSIFGVDRNKTHGSALPCAEPEEMSIKTTIALAFVAALGFAGTAQAMPVAPIQPDSLITHVRDGCGPGMARNAAGRCRPAYMARRCPPGMHRNILGRCRANR